MAKYKLLEMGDMRDDGKWVLEEGDFKLMIADQSADIHCTDTYQWSTANR